MMILHMSHKTESAEAVNPDSRYGAMEVETAEYAVYLAGIAVTLGYVVTLETVPDADSARRDAQRNIQGAAGLWRYVRGEEQPAPSTLSDM